MSARLIPRPPPEVQPPGEAVSRRPLVDSAAPVVICAYVVLAFQPFDLWLRPPGSASTAFSALGIVVLLITPNERLARLPVSLVVAALVTWMALSVLWSETPTYTMYLIRAQLVSLVVLALVVGTIPPRVVVKTLTVLFIAIVVLGVVSSLLLPMSRATTFDDIEQVGFRGTFLHKNLFGIFAVCGLCLVLPFVRDRGRSPAIAICVVAIVGSRSATVAGGLLAITFVWMWMAAFEHQRTRRDRQSLMVLSIASALAGILLVLGILPTLVGLYDKDLTFSGRTDIWAESLVTIAERPLNGYGLGGIWSDVASPLTVDLHARIGFEAAHSHNSAIELLLEVGVVGLALGVLLVVQTVRLAITCLRQPATSRYGQWGLLTVVALLLMGLAEPLFEGAYLGLLVLVWVTLSHARFVDRRGDRGRVRPHSTF